MKHRNDSLITFPRYNSLIIGKVSPCFTRNTHTISCRREQPRFVRPHNRRRKGVGTARFTPEPRATATPRAISIIDSTRFKTACVSIRRSPTLALRPPFPPSKTHPGFFLFPSRWRTRRDATRLSHSEGVQWPWSTPQMLFQIRSIGFPIRGFRFSVTRS